MRELAFTIITSVATACGLPATVIFPELENENKEKVFLPEQRMELAFPEATLRRMGWRVARRQTGPATSSTRFARFRLEQPVRVVVRGTGQAQLDTFCTAFLAALPAKVRDAAGNPVRISAHRAVRKGYTFASIRVEEAPVQALHLHFSGIIHKDVETGLLTNITIHPYYERPK